jgi:hypothetical protein
MKELLLMVFLKSFKKPTFSQNYQQRIGNFIEGYLIGSQIYETIFMYQINSQIIFVNVVIY